VLKGNQPCYPSEVPTNIGGAYNSIKAGGHQFLLNELRDKPIINSIQIDSCKDGRESFVKCVELNINVSRLQ
jgi:hypothetical protein